MAFQNNYNNYIGSQKRSSTGMFKEKVMNSLGGVAVGNNTTANKTNSVNTVVTPNVLGNSTTTNINKTTPSTPSPTTPKTAPRVGMTMTPPNNTGGVPQITTPPPSTPNVPSVPVGATETGVGGTGMLSLAEVNNALGIDNFSDVSVPIGTRSSDKTPQQMAQELVEQQKAQLQKDWEQKKAELELQKNQLNESYQQSITDANNTYQKTDEELKLNRYQQQEDLAIDATRRGIQYSPQQLALENVANINLNKNLADASKKRNELLNQLQIQINQSLENINLGLQNAVNTYNSSVTDLMSDYQKQMMDWAYNDEQTKQDREWQQKMNEENRAFEKEMTELQNKWQAEQNALDRKTYGSRSSGSSGYYRSGRGGYSSSYRPYSGYSWGSGYGNGSRNIDISTPETQEATLKTLKEYSTDLFNSANYGDSNTLYERAQVYSDVMQPILNGLRNTPGAEKIYDEMKTTYDTALTHLYNESYGRKSGLPYKVGDTWVQPSVVREPQGDKRTSTQKQIDRQNYYKKYMGNDSTWKASTLLNPSDMFSGNTLSPYLGGNLLNKRRETQFQKDVSEFASNMFSPTSVISKKKPPKSPVKPKNTKKSSSTNKTSNTKGSNSNNNKKKESFWDKLNKFISKATKKV